MRKLLFLLSFSVLMCFSLRAQLYRIYFTDKGENVEMLDRPLSLLSPKAVEHRAMRGVKIDATDLPVSREYQKEISQLGLKIEFASRWFNYVLADGLKDTNLLYSFPFVKRVEKVKKYDVEFTNLHSTQNAEDLNYGKSANQITMLNGDYLQNMGFMGGGMTIAVLDGGFNGAQKISGLRSLFNDGRVSGTYNFVNHNTDVFVAGSHGAEVLSILAGYLSDEFVGSAVYANYWLLTSENDMSETPAEMDNWLAAAEFADSVGADIITSSLGYTTFDGGDGDLTYADMDGNTAIATKAADMAAAKGILVVVSAGNEGSNSWHYISSPADGDSVLTIGGVDKNGNYATFSSVGPAADGRIKPDVVAQAEATAFLGYTGPLNGNGTSFSCPLISGLAACLWETDPGLTNMDIYYAIRSTASQSSAPDNTLGYGIANFKRASESIGTKPIKDVALDVFPNPVGDEIQYRILGLHAGDEVTAELFDLKGKVYYSDKYWFMDNGPVKFEAPRADGTYILSLRVGNSVYVKKIVKAS